MNPQVGLRAVPSLVQTIKKSPDLNVSWKCEKGDDVQSSVECLRIFINNSQTILKAGEF